MDDCLNFRHLGIDVSRGLVFEGGSTHGAHLVWPLPIMTQVRFGNATDDIHGIRTSPSNDLFREDFFDPVARIRRGRFYKHIGSGPWRVVSSQNVSVGGVHDLEGLNRINLDSYHPYWISRDKQIEFSQRMVVLGGDAASSVWTILSVETIFTGEQLVTMKARQSFGVLPEIDWTRVPVDTGLLREKIENLRDDVYRAGAESVVDRAREAATAILSAYLQSIGVERANGKDLGDLIKLLVSKNGENVQRIVACAAEIPQRLHSRGKHAEQEKRDDLRPIRGQDAELAVQCIGVMLCDLGWARWN